MNEINKISVGGTVYNIQDSRITTSSVTTQTQATKFLREDGTWAAPSYTSNDGDTKNTAGTTNNASTKMFLVGATSQAANPQTYSNANCYIGTDNCLYSNGAKVLTGYTESYTGTVTGVKVGNTSYSPLSGIISLPAYPTTLPASDVSSWAKQSSKPSYVYSEIGYDLGSTTTSAGGALSLDGSKPLHVVNLTSAAVSGLTLSTNPSAGHSCHIIFTNSTSSDLTVAIAHDSTNRVCPAGANLELTVPKNSAGYVEIDFLNVNGKIYVRGV